MQRTPKLHSEMAAKESSLFTGSSYFSLFLPFSLETTLEPPLFMGPPETELKGRVIFATRLHMACKYFMGAYLSPPHKREGNFLHCLMGGNYCQSTATAKRSIEWSYSVVE